MGDVGDVGRRRGGGGEVQSGGVRLFIHESLPPSPTSPRHQESLSFSLSLSRRPHYTIIFCMNVKIVKGINNINSTRRGPYHRDSQLYPIRVPYDALTNTTRSPICTSYIRLCLPCTQPYLPGYTSLLLPCSFRIL